MSRELLGRTLSRRWISSPVLVVGAGRSGTGVLKRALGSHPAVLAADGESPAVFELALALLPFLQGEHLHYFRSSMKLPQAVVEERLRRLCLEAAIGPHFGLRLMAREAVRSGSRPGKVRRWCAKTFPTEEAARCLEHLYEEVRFVYIVRNGLEVVYSRTRFPGMRHLSFEDQCREWASTVERYRYLLEHPRARLVRQEQMLRQPQEVLAGLFAFLGLGAAPGPTELVRTTLVHSLDEQTRSGVDVRQVLESRPKGYEEWGSDERLTFKHTCAEAMEELGYEVPF